MLLIEEVLLLAKNLHETITLQPTEEVTKGVNREVKTPTETLTQETILITGALETIAIILLEEVHLEVLVLVVEVQVLVVEVDQEGNL